MPTQTVLDASDFGSNDTDFGSDDTDFGSDDTNFGPYNMEFSSDAAMDSLSIYQDMPETEKD